MFQAQATVHKVSTLVDGGLKVEIMTRELQPEQMTAVFEQKGSEGWFLFKENSIKPEEIKDLPDVRVEKTDKSPSERLRAVLYRLWETTSKTKTADQFYKEYIDKTIEAIKEKLN